MGYKDPQKQSDFQKSWYLKNKDKVRISSTASKIRKTLQIRKIKETPCADCKIRYPYYVMQFDHREGEIKIAPISIMLLCYAFSKVLDEIKKCDIVCANCHAVRTYKRTLKSWIIP